MVKEIKMFEANDGSTHHDQHAALRADLKHLLLQSKGINEASAVAVVDMICKDGEYRTELINTLQLLDDERAPRDGGLVDPVGAFPDPPMARTAWDDVPMPGPGPR